MKLLVGLGNPGEKYARNRHNVGFMFADFVRQKLSEEGLPISDFKYDKYTNAEVAAIPQNKLSAVSHKPLAIIKPQNFMNRSGETVRKLAISYKLSANSFYVAHDDLDILIGKFKIQQSTGPKLHNGLESIEHAIGTKDFWRIRIGVENRPDENRMPGEAFVLQNFTAQELKVIQSLFPIIADRLKRDYLH